MGVVQIAEFNNTIIGKVHLEVRDGIGGIYGLGVLPEYRRKGYGREILIKSVQLLKAKQVNEVMLQVSVETRVL
ncbi:GNAT family N-acetyltransferase [Siminovitchia terrae]|uniref:GNAT family N-acetyltransferase n=1 Tax=Siminovitchia terrae TaxID=1914933 RepID=A0A429X1F2_SIMTE|nr:GNAT family N-acetyltransferase [Siminovitchia terrae]RST57038.1 GNAT family N-acetyltransferase [Siminovitchia terrae]